MPLTRTPANPFTPLYIFESELATYGLPSPTANPQILGLVSAASLMCDFTCMKQDLNGNGSLAYSTYTERVPIRRGGPGNIFRLSKRPLVGISAGTVQALEASGADLGDLPSNCYDNGALAAIGERLNGDGELCSIIAISGRYSATRRGDPTPDYMLSFNPFMASQLGSAPTWFPLDPLQCDYDPMRGEVWAPPGIYMYRFTDLQVTYTSGFNPLAMPPFIKQATANIVKNLLAKPIPGITNANFTDAALSLQFAPSYVDNFTAGLLEPYKNTVYA